MLHLPEVPDELGDTARVQVSCLRVSVGSSSQQAFHQRDIQPVFLGQGGPDQRPQLLGVSRHHQLPHLPVQDPGQGDAGLGLGGLAGLVDEDVPEVVLRREMLGVRWRPGT